MQVHWLGEKRMKHKIYKCKCDVFKSFIFFCYYYLLLNRNKNRFFFLITNSCSLSLLKVTFFCGRLWADEY